MEKILLLVLLTAGGLSCFRIVEKPSRDNDYWAERAKILKEEENSMLGGDLKFERKERIANEVLMSAKRKEVDDGLFFFRLLNYHFNIYFLAIYRTDIRKEIYLISESRES